MRSRFQEFAARRNKTRYVLAGLLVGVLVGLIVSAFILTGIYVRRANGEFDDLNNAILKEAAQ